jgi:hypothetical protein
MVIMAIDTRTVSATEFKAKCLEIPDEIGERRVRSEIVTKRGPVVAVLVPPPDEEATARGLHGFLRGSVLVPVGLDVTASVLEGPFAAEH